MRKLQLLGAIAAGLVGGVGAGQAADPFFPTYGNDLLDVRNYDLDLAVEPVRHTLAGTAVLDVRAKARLPSFTLDLSGLTVTAVRVDGVAARFSRRPGKLEVRPAAAIPRGRTFRLAVRYRGAPASLDDPTAPDQDPPFQLGWTNYNRTSYVVSEPIGASTWFPVNDQPTDKASYRIAVTVPKPYQAVGNGALRRTVELGDRRRFVWEQRQPMASWLAMLDVGDFDREKVQAANGIIFRTFASPGTSKRGLTALRRTPEMLTFFERLVGRYPFDAYGSITITDPALTYALETQGMSTFPDDFGEATVAHELAHQWFGNAVTVSAWRHLWLGEGFATYFEYLWQYRADRPGLEAAFQDLYRQTKADRVGPAVVSRPEDIFAANTYDRGALTLHALRLTAGDAAFFRTLSTWYRTYKGGNANSEQFIQTAVAQSRTRGIRPLLRAWLYDREVPPYPGGLTTTAVADAAPHTLERAVRRRR